MSLNSRSIIVAAGGASLAAPVTLNYIPLVSSVAQAGALSNSIVFQRTGTAGFPAVQIGPSASGANVSPVDGYISAPVGTGNAQSGALIFTAGVGAVVNTSLKPDVEIFRIGSFGITRGAMFVGTGGGSTSPVLLVGFVEADSFNLIGNAISTPIAQSFAKEAMRSVNVAAVPYVQTFRANGTFASPTQVLSGDVIGAFSFMGLNSGFSNSGVAEGAGIYAVATENWTQSFNPAAGAYLSFRAKPNTEIAGGAQEAFRVLVATGSPTITEIQGRRGRLFINCGNTANSILIGGASESIGFYNATPVTRQTLPLGSTTDQVITALQNLGLVGP